MIGYMMKPTIIESCGKCWGHSDWYDEHYYEMQTLKDNISLLTPELLDEINQVIVKSRQQLLKKKESEALRNTAIKLSLRY